MHWRKLLRGMARGLTGSTFVLLGLDAAREPGGRVSTAGGTLASIRKVLPLPHDDELIVRANGAAMALGGAALAAGRLPRAAAIGLVASLVPTTLAGHAYWGIEDPAQRSAQRVQFHKNLALLGGLLFAVLVEDGPEH
jgi:uncharacterized membrane protein YphA (DoxX/SURF4 family)